MNDASAPVTSATSATHWFAERRQRILDANLGAVLEKQALSMCTIDEATDPEILKERGLGELAAAIETCTAFLHSRVLRRASYAVFGREFAPPTAEDERHRRAAVQVEARLRAAIEAAFPPPAVGAPFAVRDFEQTFCSYVTGEIGMGALVGVTKDHPLFGHGVPDSANHFCWPEGALYFVRLGLHADFWRATLPALVCSAQFFAATFWNRRTRTSTDYDCRNLRRAHAASATVLAVLDHHFRALTLPELAADFGRLLATALRDDRSLGQPIPSSLEFP